MSDKKNRLRQLAKRGNPLLIAKDDMDRREFSMEQRFGPLADALTLDAICGHSAKTKGQDYTKVSLKKRMEAMASFPRYVINETGEQHAAWG